MVRLTVPVPGSFFFPCQTVIVAIFILAIFMEFICSFSSLVVPYDEIESRKILLDTPNKHVNQGK